MTDNGSAPHRVDRCPDQLDRLDVVWRVMGLTGVVWECVWYRHGATYELRIQREANTGDVVAVRKFSAITDEMETCLGQWLRETEAKGFVRLED